MLLINGKEDFDNNQDDAIANLCSHIANGGVPTEVCRAWKVSYSYVFSVIQSNEQYKKLHAEACKARQEWAKEELFAQIRNIGLSDIRHIVDEKGGIKPTEEWPSEMAASVAGIDVYQEKDSGGYTTKIKFWDKLKAIQLLGKELGMFVEKHEHTGKFTLEDLVDSSRDMVGDE